MQRAKLPVDVTIAIATNEMLSFTAHGIRLCSRIYAISVKLSPEKKSSGIQCLEASNFKVHCFQTLTGESLEMAKKGNTCHDVITA